MRAGCRSDVEATYERPTPSVTIRARVACRESRKWQLHSKVRCGQEEMEDVRERPVPKPSVHFSEGG